VKTTIGLLSSRGHKHRSGTQAKAPSASKRRPAQGALSQDELLAKIDSLDWDQTVTAATVAADGSGPNGQYPDHSTSNWRVGAIVAIIAVVFTVLYFLLAPEPAPRHTDREAPTPISAVSSVDNQAAAVAPETSAADVAAADERRSAKYAHAIEEADAKAQQKLDAQRQARQARQARDAERARLTAQQERDRRQREETRLRAERDAAEAARAAKAREQAVVPKGPASPQELCASEGGIIARGFCEARACGKAEWRSHPFCVKRMDDQLRSFGQGG
jgi:flagellar biosynthesis GTPase FlhF